MKKTTIIVHADDGTGGAKQKGYLVDLIRGLQDGRKYEVTIADFRKKRSLSQNALMWKWIGEVVSHVADHTGMDADEIHEFFKSKFLAPRVLEVNGEFVSYRTTTKLTTREMSDYMDKINAWATAELGIILPNPDDYGREIR